MRTTLAILAASAIVGGCVERAPELSPADRERIREFVGTEAPSPENALEVRFNNGIELLGYDVSGESATPGQAVTVTWYWRATRDVDDGWQLFTHVADGGGENRLNQDGVGTVRELYQPSRWRAGQYIRDVQEVTLPEDWNSDEAVFYLGLWRGDFRLAIERGPNDGDNRVRALSLDVSSAPSAAAAGSQEEAPTAELPAAPPPPTLRVQHAQGGVTIDGDLGDDAWRRAARSTAFVNTLNGGQAPFRAGVRTLWDEDNLYVAFDVADDFVQNTLTDRDAHLWEQDAVEIMLDPDGDGRNYFELQVSPSGVVFDTRYDTRRRPQPIGHADWNAPVRARVQVRGTANDDGNDQGYTAEIAIPWSAFAVGTPPAARPRPNDSWRANFYVMDQRRGNGADRSAGWSPTLTGDFHVPARFGTLRFAAPAPAPVAVRTQNAGRPYAIPAADVLPPESARRLQAAMRRDRRGVVAQALRNQQGR